MNRDKSFPLEIEKLRLKEENLNRICYHSSYLPQSEDLVNYNKYIYSLGKSILTLCYGVYLYRHGLISDISSMYTSLYSRGAIIAVINLHCSLCLESFVIKSELEDKSIHEEYSIKLIGLIYKEKGIRVAYEFIAGYFHDPNIAPYPLEPIIDYALKTGINFNFYKYYDNSNNNEKHYCRIDLGSKKVIESSNNTIEAVQKAVDIIITDFAIRKEGYLPKAKFNYSVLKPITMERINELYKSLSCFNLTAENLSPALINRVFTVDSIDGTIIGNGCLVELGDILLDSFAIDFIYSYTSNNTAPIEKDDLLKTSVLAKLVPDNSINSMSNGPIAPFDESVCSGLKANILKSLCAALCIEAIEKDNKEAFSDANTLALVCFYQIVSAPIIDMNTNYWAIAYNICTRNNIHLMSSSDWINNGIGHKGISQVHVTAQNIWSETVDGVGANHQEAINDAGHKLLVKLIPHLKENKYEIKLIEKIIKTAKVEKNINTEVDALKTKLFDIQSVAIDVSKVPSQPEVLYKHRDFNTSGETLYICKGTVACRRKNHKIISVTGIIRTLNGKSVSLNVNYCEACKKYFINYDEYKHYQTKYGAILGRFKFSSNDSISSGLGELSPESILRMCGYNVGQYENLSAKERHAILVSMIEYEIISKARIMEYLQFFIRRSKRIDNMYYAVSKWEADLDWIRSYNFNKQKQVKISKIKR